MKEVAPSLPFLPYIIICIYIFLDEIAFNLGNPWEAILSSGLQITCCVRSLTVLRAKA